MRTSASLYHRHRFPAEIISHSVWLYFRFALSFRDVEEMLAMRGVVLTYETVREWCLKFGLTYANDLRRRSPRPGDRWHLDEVFLKINGRLHYLWGNWNWDRCILRSNRYQPMTKSGCSCRNWWLVFVLEVKLTVPFESLNEKAVAFLISDNSSYIARMELFVAGRFCASG